MELLTKKILILIVFCFLFLWLACKKQDSNIPTTEQKIAIADTIQQLAKAFEKGINQLDLESQFRIFTDDPDFTFAEDGKIFPPKDSMRMLFEPFYGSIDNMTFAWDTMRVVVLSPNSGIFTGSGRYSFTTKKGVIGNGNVVSTYVFARRGGKWRLIHGHASHARRK